MVADFGPQATRLLSAVLAGETTIRGAQRAARIASPSTALKHARALRLAGLVDFKDRRAGTLRPSVRVVGRG